MSAIRLWLVTDFGPAAGQSAVVGAAYVWAADEPKAAELGRAALKIENLADDQDYCATVAVTCADPQWFEFDAKAIPCQLQCCGGADTPDGHSGFCSHHETTA